jgi:hypothetical protein
MLEFLVGCGGGDEETAFVACSEAADDARSGDGGVADGDDVLEFGFENTARVLVSRCLAGVARYECCATCGG